MTIMVIGGAGYIGSHVAHALADLGESSIVFDNLTTGRRASVPANTPFIQGDCNNTSQLTEVIQANRVSAILHFAGSIIVSESMAKPLEYYRNNTSNTRNVLEAAVRCNVKHFVFSSSAAVYGNPTRLPIVESDPPSPLSPYGQSKLMSEVMLADVSRTHSLTHIALRYFNVAGADPQMRTGQSSPVATHLIKLAIQTALGRQATMQIYGSDYPTADGTCIRDYVHVTDLAQAHIDALKYLQSGGKSATLNCGYGHGASVLEVIETVRRIAGVHFPTQQAPRRQGDPASLVACSERVRKILGWQPRFDDLNVIVRHALSWDEKLIKEEA